jgi:hypothetical protein
MKLEIEIQEETIKALIDKFQKQNFAYESEVKIITPQKVVELIKKGIETDLDTISWDTIDSLESSNDLYNMILNDLSDLPIDEELTAELLQERDGDDEHEYERDYATHLADSPSFI